MKRNAEAEVYWKESMATLREHQLPRTSYGTGLLQLQMWLDEIHGLRMSDADVQALVREAAEFATADTATSRQLLANCGGRLLTGVAEAIIEETIFKRRIPRLSDLLRSRLALLRRAKLVGIDRAYRE